MGVPPRHREETGLLFRTSDAIFASDESYRIVVWNEAAEALLGYAKEDVLGTPCHEMVGCPSLTRRLFCGAGARGTRRLTREMIPTFGTQMQTKSGDRVCIDVSTIVTIPRRGPPLRVHLLRDVTRQRQIEELLRHVVTGASRLSVASGLRADADGNGNGNGTAATRVGAGDDGQAPCSWAVTVREREVIQLLAQGTSTEGIAAKLRISRRTARNHIQNILAKLRVHSRLEAVAYASTKGLL